MDTEFKSQENTRAIKQRVILGAYFLDARLNEECAMNEASLREVPLAMLEAARQVLVNTRDRIF